MAKSSSAHKMRKQFCQLLPLLNGTAKFVERVLEDLPRHDFLLETNVKEYKRTVEKAKERHIKDLTDLSDLVRGRIYFSDNYNFEEVIELLKALFKERAKIKDIDWKEKNQYKDSVHMDLKIGELNFELQIVPIEFKPYKNLLHHIYEQLRSDNLTEKKRKFLQILNTRLYNELDKKYKENRS